MIRPWLILLSLGFFVQTVYGARYSESSRGTSGAQFLKLGAGARAAALGEAYSAVADDATSIYWNPAALVRSKQSASLTHSNYFDSVNYDHLAWAKRVDPQHAVGLGLQYFSAGKITQTDAVTGADGRSITPSDLAVAVGAARRLTSGYSFGVGLKYIQTRLVDSGATAGADLGVLSPPWLRGRFRAAAAIANVGGRLQLEQKSDPLPTTVRLGASYKITDPWMAAVDVVFPRDNRPAPTLGTEYRWRVQKSLTTAGRLGYNTRSDVPNFSGLSLGFGMIFRNAELDYGLVPFGELGLIHRVSLSYRL